MCCMETKRNWQQMSVTVNKTWRLSFSIFYFPQTETRGIVYFKLCQKMNNNLAETPKQLKLRMWEKNVFKAIHLFSSLLFQFCWCVLHLRKIRLKRITDILSKQNKNIDFMKFFLFLNSFWCAPFGFLYFYCNIQHHLHSI